MSRYIYKLLAFIFPLILFFLILFIVANKNHQFQPSSMYYSQEFKSAFEDKDFDVVLIGNSKLLSAIDKETLEENNKHSVVNLGYSSSNISVSKLTLESYLNNCTNNPKLVLLEVSWFTFNNQRTQLHSIVGDLFIKDFKIWKNYFNYNSEMLLPKIKSSWKGSIKNIFGNKTLEDKSYVDRFSKSTPFTVDYNFDVKEMEIIFPKHLAGIDSLLLNDFYSIVEMCKSKDIDLILFTAPEDEMYSRYQKDIKRIKRVFSDIADYNSNVFYLDYSLNGNLYDKEFENWLQNSHHINENVLFTKKIIEDMKARTHNSVYKK